MGTEHGAGIGVWQLVLMVLPISLVIAYFIPTIAVLRTKIGKRTYRTGFLLWTLFGILFIIALGAGQYFLKNQLGVPTLSIALEMSPLRFGIDLIALAVQSVLAYVYFRQLARRTYDAGLERWVAYMAALNPLALPFVVLFLFFRPSRKTARPHLLV